MSLNWSIGEIEDYRSVCYERMTADEVLAMGTTIEKLVADHSSPWYTPGESEQEKVANCDTVERMSVLTNCLIWATMIVGLGGITKENYGEFWARIHFVEKLSGPFLHRKTEDGQGWEPSSITLEEIQAHIGLGCNVSNESWSSWSKRAMDQARKDLLRGEKLEAGPWHDPISQVAKDTEEQLERLEKALRDHSFYGELEEPADEQAEKDLERVYKMTDNARCIASDWEDLEWKQEEAELEEE